MLIDFLEKCFAGNLTSLRMRRWVIGAIDTVHVSPFWHEHSISDMFQSLLAIIPRQESWLPHTVASSKELLESTVWHSRFVVCSTVARNCCVMKCLQEAFLHNDTERKTEISTPCVAYGSKNRPIWITNCDNWFSKASPACEYYRAYIAIHTDAWIH